jgi:enamine deaminase RidA (YjgF/YER057c/UK114 family)
VGAWTSIADIIRKTGGCVERKNISSGTAWEALGGYSRAVRLGNVVEVAGTTAVDENGQLFGGSDPYLQARYIFSKIDKALIEAGARMTDVVRTRLYVTDIDHWEAVVRAHGEVFGTIRPAATLVAVSSLVRDDLLVEIEATAILSE